MTTPHTAKQVRKTNMRKIEKLSRVVRAGVQLQRVFFRLARRFPPVAFHVFSFFLPLLHWRTTRSEI